MPADRDRLSTQQTDNQSDSEIQIAAFPTEFKVKTSARLLTVKLWCGGNKVALIKNCPQTIIIHLLIGAFLKCSLYSEGPTCGRPHSRGTNQLVPPPAPQRRCSSRDPAGNATSVCFPRCRAAATGRVLPCRPSRTRRSSTHTPRTVYKRRV